MLRISGALSSPPSAWPTCSGPRSAAALSFRQDRVLLSDQLACEPEESEGRCLSASSSHRKRSGSSPRASGARRAGSCSARSCAPGSTRSRTTSSRCTTPRPSRSSTTTICRCSPPGTPSLEVGQPIANKEFLLGAFAAPRRAPPRGAADRRGLQGRRRLRGRRQRGAGARHRAAMAVRRAPDGAGRGGGRALLLGPSGLRQLAPALARAPRRRSPAARRRTSVAAGRQPPRASRRMPPARRSPSTPTATRSGCPASARCG